MSEMSMKIKAVVALTAEIQECKAVGFTQIGKSDLWDFQPIIQGMGPTEDQAEDFAKILNYNLGFELPSDQFVVEVVEVEIPVTEDTDLESNYTDPVYRISVEHFVYH